MGKESLSLIFGSGKTEYKRVAPWYEALVAEKAAYEECFVVSFTRVKNLGSKYMHEYCQFIVEDRSSGDRARVYVERMNEDDVDVVTWGVDEKQPRKWDELPLPLTSIAYKDKAQQPRLADVAKIISSVSTIGGKYTFYNRNCFWFAFTAFESLKTVFAGTIKNWLWVNPGGLGGGSVGDAWGLGFPTMFKFLFKSSAKGFEKERTNGMEWYDPSETRDPITPSQFVKDFGSHLLEPESFEAYQNFTRELGISLNQEDLLHVLSSVQAKVAGDEQKNELAWTQEFDTAVSDLIKKTLADPSVADNVALVEAKQASLNRELDLGLQSAKSQDSQAAASSQQPSKEEQLVKSLKALVGAVITEAGFA